MIELYTLLPFPKFVLGETPKDYAFLLSSHRPLEDSSKPGGVLARTTTQQRIIQTAPTEQANSPVLQHPFQVPYYKLITTLPEAIQALQSLAAKGDRVGLDLETTGLSTHEGAKARLLQVSPQNGPVLVMDLFSIGGLEALRDSLQPLKAVAHNAVFEMAFLKAAGISLTLDCTLLAHHILTGEMARLSDICKAYLDVSLDKTLQTSDWSHELTEEQIRYAALDAYYTRVLFDKMFPLIEKEGAERVYQVCKEAQPAVVDMGLTGMPFDAEAHQALIESLTLERDTYKNRLTAAFGSINVNSGKQLGDWLTTVLGGSTSASFNKWPKTPKGHLSTSEEGFTKGLPLLPEEMQHLITDVFLPYKTVEKHLTAFGEGLKKFISPTTGRIHASFKMTGTKTGRFSCSNPNLQQIPRDKAFRSLFKAPEGRTFVIADYSQMELRVAALVAQETSLLKAYEEGKDTHAITAGMLLNKNPADVTKQERQLAKAVNFGLLYGQGAKGLKDYAANSYGVTISEAQAKTYRDAWFKAYPDFESWHRLTDAVSRTSGRVTTPLGRTRHFSASGDMYCATKAYNTPIQGGAAEVMLAALGKLTDLLQSFDAKLIAVIHDEVIVETSLNQAAEVSQVLEQAMVQGMLDIFPKASTRDLVEAKSAPSWAEK